MFYSILQKPPYDMRVDDDGAGCASVIVAVASDDNRIVSVVCELAETDGICDETCWEFSFSISIFALDDSIEPLTTQDRHIAANYLPVGVREAVRDVVWEGLKPLKIHKTPPLIYWVTKDRVPPEKALRKYHLLTET